MADWLDEVRWDVRSRNVRIAQREVVRHLKSFRLIPRRTDTLFAQFAHRQLGRLSATLIGYGDAVRLEAGKLGKFSILHVPLRGSYVMRTANGDEEIGTSEAHLIPSGVPLTMEWSADCMLLVLRFDVAGARTLGLEGTSNSEKAALGYRIGLSSRPGFALGELIEAIAREGFCGSLYARDGKAGEAAEQLVLASLRQALNAATRLDGSETRMSSAPPPGSVERAQRYMLERLREPVRLSSVAAASGIAPSTLTRDFNRVHGIGPLAWWRQRRLDRVYEALEQAPAARDAITSAALEWGFQHPGRMARHYAKRFGETPRRTLQRARALRAAE